MAFTPKEITKEHILKAIEKIESDYVELIPSTRWNVSINDKEYAPKEVMRYAHEQMNGEKVWEYSGGVATNNLLEKFGFEIIDKNINLKNLSNGELINLKRNFINWFIERDGTKKSYFSNNFSSNPERFIKEINEYEENYKKNFNSELFLIRRNNFQNKIKSISDNIYSKQVDFSEYSKNKSAHMPRAILGKENYIKFLNDYFLNEVSSQSIRAVINNTKMPLNQILYGPPGTGKTYNTINKALELIGEDIDDLSREEIKELYEGKVKDGQIVFTTFHQSLSYEDFIEGIKPKTNDDGNVIYEIKDGVFKNLCFKAAEKKTDINAEGSSSELLEDTETSQKNYVLIIDEINRGNVSKIFGELITLIEESKRAGKSEAITATLPYSKTEFSVPANVFILGTMNTADRSVEALDTALRRRFDFVEMMPKYDLVSDDEKERYVINGIPAFDILKTINDRIEVLLGRDHLIGHSFFILNDDETIDIKVKSAFYKNIIPLLQEYFYGDYNKIGLVLGSGFVTKTRVVESKRLFANSKDFNGDDYVSGESYTYRITGLKDDSSFYKALGTLMNNPTSSESNED
jgi:DNA replication protein DnaC